MGGLPDRLTGMAAALWWGSLTSIGFVVVPLLFASLPTPALAGQTAARLFTAQTWISLGCTLLMLVATRSVHGGPAARRVQAAIGFVVLGLLLALLAEFAVAPHIVARDNLRLWHSVGSAMYLVQWVCAAVVLWRVIRPSAA